MAKTSQYLALHILLILLFFLDASMAETWCVARTDVETDKLQRAIDYACSSGADCAPILSNGLCYLPNTLQNHASYAFNSYCQRKAMAPGCCDFGGTAVAAATDPSYGACVYPSSLSTAGGGSTTVTPSIPTGTLLTPTPTTNVPVNPLFSPPTSFSNGGFGDGSVPSTSPRRSLIENYIISVTLYIFFLLFL